MLTQLRSLTLGCVPMARRECGAQATVDLQPLSALRRLSSLGLLGLAATGVHRLPAVSSLYINPATGTNLCALGAHTQLRDLRLHMDGSCSRTAAGYLRPAAFRALGALSRLRSLSLWSEHLICMGGAAGLPGLQALEHLQIDFGTCTCRINEPGRDEDLVHCSLAALTQLRSVGCSCTDTLADLSSGAAELQALQTHQLPRLDRLSLISPWEVESGEYRPMVIRAPLVEVDFFNSTGDDWCQLYTGLHTLKEVYEAACLEQRPCFTELRLSGWPDLPPDAQLRGESADTGFFMDSWSGIHGVLRYLELEGVRVCTGPEASTAAENATWHAMWSGHHNGVEVPPPPWW